jgi:DNA replication licensing factor MCM2
MATYSSNFQDNLSKKVFRHSDDHFDENVFEDNRYMTKTVADMNEDPRFTFSESSMPSEILGNRVSNHKYEEDCPNILSERTDLGISIERFHGSIRDFLCQNAVQLEVARRFKLFLRTFEVNSEKVYISHINDVARIGGKSIQVDYIEFATVNPTLGMWIADAPKPMLEILDGSARTVLIELYPDNNNVTSEIYVRFNNVPINDSLRNIRNIHLNSLVRVIGVVTRCTGIFPQLLTTNFFCGKCGYKIGPFVQNNCEIDTKPIACPNCQTRRSFILNDQ